MKVHVQGPGHVAFAVGAAGLGALCLVYGDFARQYQTVPAWFPWPHALAYVAGVVLIAGAAGLLFDHTAKRAALVLTAYQAIWVVLRVRDILPHPDGIDRWNAFAESFGVLVGSLILFLDGERAVAIARRLFGVSCVIYGLAHFKYAHFTQGMVPAWMPARTELVYVAGAGHFAAGVALLTSIGARIGVTLEAIMLSAFVVLVHVPSLFASPPLAWAPTTQIQLTELFVALALTGTAAIVARSAARAR